MLTCLASAVVSAGFELPAAAQDAKTQAHVDAEIAKLRAAQEAALAKMQADQDAALASLRRKEAELDRQLAKVTAQQAQLAAQQAATEQAQAASRAAAATAAADPSKAKSAEPAPVSLSLLGVPVHLFGNITLRYDYSTNSNLTESLTNGIQANWLLTRIRFGAEFGDTGPVIGGFRFSSGENPNPAVPFVSLSSAFQPAAIGMDQAWATVRPFDDREQLQFTIGRMKNPFWRGSIGTVRTQMQWDDDVNLAGAALTARFYKSKGAAPFTISNTIAYMQVQSALDAAFIGLTGVVSGLGDQVRFTSKYVDGGVSYYEWLNLNTGLSVPTSQPSAGYVSAQTPTSAFLLTPGFQQTNTVVNYGPAGGASTGFLDPTYKILNPTVQVHVPFKSPKLGDPDAYVLFDYAHNFLPSHTLNAQGNLPTATPQTCASCTPVAGSNGGSTTTPSLNDGVGITVGARLGDKTYQHGLHPMNVWVTYRYVESNAALATFADSDLGAGTGYQGWAFGTNYRILPHLMTSVQYFDFMGYPLMENHVQRLFVDVMGDF